MVVVRILVVVVRILVVVVRILVVVVMSVVVTELLTAVLLIADQYLQGPVANEERVVEDGLVVVNLLVGFRRFQHALRIALTTHQARLDVIG